MLSPLLIGEEKSGMGRLKHRGEEKEGWTPEE